MVGRTALPRRVYRNELRLALGMSTTWFREMQAKGRIPIGHRDADGRREWFTEKEALAIIEKLNTPSVPKKRAKETA